MAAAEPYDYLPTITADYDYTLTIKAQGKITEEGEKKQIIRTGDDFSEERISLSSTSVFYIIVPWKILSASESGTIVELYHNASKANGMVRSFRCSIYDGHTYVVRFDCKVSRIGQAVSRMEISPIRLRILGRIVDA